jgi:hypothetical protein
MIEWLGEDVSDLVAISLQKIERIELFFGIKITQIILDRLFGVN